MQGNQLVIMNVPGTQIIAGIGGGVYTFWSGASSGKDANFRVNTSGRLEATGADIAGVIRSNASYSPYVTWEETADKTLDPGSGANIAISWQGVDVNLTLPKPSDYDGLTVRLNAGFYVTRTVTGTVTLISSGTMCNVDEKKIITSYDIIGGDGIIECFSFDGRWNIKNVGL
jgi:hypothetical protein